MLKNYQIPSELEAFLKKYSGKEFKSTSQQRLDVRRVKFYSLDELEESYTILDTSQYYLNHGEQGDDPEVTYRIPSIDLIKSDCDDNYYPEGLLQWYPTLNCFGSSDCGHLVIYVFPAVKWSKIFKSLWSYINTQWNGESKSQILFCPWREQGFNRSFKEYIKG